MADLDRFSAHLIDLAERFADVTDAAQGRGNRGGGTIRARWLLLPAAGAGLYALGASGAVARQAKSVVNQAKERASELPDDLMGRVQQATGSSGTRSTSGTRRKTAQPSQAARRTSTRSRKSTGRTASRARTRTRAKATS